MKILISDYDGTLFINENDLKNNASKIAEFREEKNIFIISTARNYSSIKDACVKKGIIVDYFFCDIGSVILDFDGNLIYEQHIEKGNIEKIEKVLEMNKNKLDVTRYGTHNKIKENFNKAKLIEYKIKGEIQYLVEVKKIIEKEVPEVKIQITEDNRLIIHTSTKENIIEKFLSNTGMKSDCVYTVGDELDDLEMLKKYNGYRMKICNPIVKENIKKEVTSVSQVIDILNKKVD